jgi:hypothetical protein
VFDLLAVGSRGSQMTAAAVAKAESHAALRKQIRELADELAEIREKAEHKVVRLANLVHRVQKTQVFREWINPQTKKPFTSFEDWIKVDVRQSKSSVYRFIGVKEHLNKHVSDETLEMIGESRCFELVKIAKEKPKQLTRIVKEIEKNPKMTVFALQQMTANVLEGNHFDSGQYERLDFAVKVEDAVEVKQAFAVMQALEPVKNPDAASGRGLHLVNLCREYLSGKEERKALRRLEDAGAFKNGNTNFEIED